MKPGDFLTVFAVYNQGNEGEATSVSHYCSTSDDAATTQHLANTWHRGHAPIEQFTAVVGEDGKIYDIGRKAKPIDVMSHDDAVAAARDEALSRLTPEQRRLLGVADD